MVPLVFKDLAIQEYNPVDNRCRKTDWRALVPRKLLEGHEIPAMWVGTLKNSIVPSLPLAVRARVYEPDTLL